MRTIHSILVLLFMFCFSCGPNNVKRINNCCEGNETGVSLNDSTYIWAPTAFSPNIDGSNDFFALFVSPNISTYSIEIKTPGGATVFTSNDPNNHWTGIKDQGSLDDDNGNSVLKARSYNFSVQAETTSGEAINFDGKVCLITECKDTGELLQCTFPDQLGASGITGDTQESLCQ